MLSNYLTIALRNLRKTPVFTAINVFGLALGMSASLVVIQIVRDQLAFDCFHPNPECTYRINTDKTFSRGGSDRFATAPYPVGDALMADFSVAESVVRVVRGLNGNLGTTAQNVSLPLKGYFTEPSFFQLFGYQMRSGNAASALTEPNSIVLTPQLADRFFGRQEALNQRINIEGWGEFKITGILEEPPGKSHLQFDCLASASSIPAKERGYRPEETERRVTDNWQNTWANFLYVGLRPDKTERDLAAALDVLAEKRKNIESTIGGSDLLRYFPQKITRITPAPEMLANYEGAGLPWFFIWGLAILGGLLIIFPGLNYANLALARALGRLREIGVRKVVGARKSDVLRQFLVESVLTAMLALGVAWFLHLPVKQFAEQKLMTIMAPGAEMGSLLSDTWTWLFFGLFALLVGLFSGWLPAWRLSRSQPAAALKGEEKNLRVQKWGLGWRKALTVGQFATSLILMMLVAGLWAQVRYMSLADYGFDRENILSIPIGKNDWQTLSAELSRDRHAVSVAAASYPIASNWLQSCDFFAQPGGEPASMAYVSADQNYLSTLGLQLLAGENFPAWTNGQPERYLILNEQALQAFELGSPAEAVGKSLWLNDTTPLTVRGVVADFHYQSLTSSLDPLALRFDPTQFSLLHVQIPAGDPAQTLASLESAWKKVDPIHPFEPEFFSEQVAKGYADLGMMAQLIGFFALLALSVSCLGLLGMVTFTIGRRVKEIGIRKVVGASAVQVAVALSRQFLILLGIAVALSAPIGWWLSSWLLNNFAYRVDFHLGFVLGCAGLLLALGLLTIGIQAIRAALTNPVKSLRSE